MPLEFVTLIENVTFPLVSSDETMAVKLAIPLAVIAVNGFPNKFPAKWIRSVLSVTSVTVMFLPAFAKLLEAPLLVIFRDVIFIESASITVMILLVLDPRFPAVSESAMYV